MRLEEFANKVKLNANNLNLLRLRGDTMNSKPIEYECAECEEVESHNLHHDVANPMTSADVHFDECDYSASYEGAIQGWVPSMLCHEYERGCYCADRGRCDVCVEKAVDYADHLRDAAKEGM